MTEPAHRAGPVLPPWTLVGSTVVVAIAVVAFLVSGTPDRTAPASAQPTATPTEASTGPDEPRERRRDAEPEPDPEPEPARPRVRRNAYVEVYNNSSVSGLAADTAADLTDAGWDVVGTDNWSGDIPRTTVYHPERMVRQARLLARDLGADRIRPAVDPMRFDRLTVILVGDL